MALHSRPLDGPAAQTTAFCVPPADEVIPRASRIGCCFGSARVALRTCTVRPSAVAENPLERRPARTLDWPLAALGQALQIYQ